MLHLAGHSGRAEFLRPACLQASRNANKFKGIGSSDVQGGLGTFGSSSSGADYGYGGFGGGFGGGKSGGSRSQVSWLGLYTCE